MKIVTYTARAAVLAGVCSLTACGAPEVSEMEGEYPSIREIAVDSEQVSALSIGAGELAASFEVASVLLDEPVDRIAASWEAYAEGGRTRLEARANAGTWVPFVVEHEELVPETGLTLYVGYVDMPAGTTEIDTRLVLERANVTSLSPVVSDLKLEAFDVVDIFEDGEAPELAEDEDALDGTLAHRPDLVSRDAWNAKPPRCSGSVHNPFKMTFHHTVTPNGEKGAAARARMRQIQAGHFARGFCDVGYHFVVDAEGKIYRGRVTASRTGGHVENQNTGNIGVALMGNFVSAPLRDPQMNGLVRALAWQGDKWNVQIDGSHVRGHQQWPGTATACPGSKTLARKATILSLTRKHINQH